MRAFLTRVFGDPAEKELKRLQASVAHVNEAESKYSQLSDEDLKSQTDKLKDRISEGESADDVLVDAFAVMREAASRVLGMRHFDVQLLGGMVMHKGNIAEMKTGEGKTLVATLPVYLNALSGNSVHVVTVNDYLAQRDAGWMGEVYDYLGLSVGVIANGNNAFIYDSEFEDESHSDPRLRHFRRVDKKETYDCDVVYGTNNEFGFDYLRDNMATSKDKMVQRDLSFAIVDEVDSILIDEARTPLIISAPAEKSVDLYQQYAAVAGKLEPEVDYKVDEKRRVSTLTDEGVSKVEDILNIDNLYDSDHVQAVFHLDQALKAQSLYTKDKNYVVRDGEVVIVDEFTGRMMPGRRFSEGIHQAIEAKEGVRVLQESMTLATISFQNYFRQYEKLSGMTGTAKTEEEEFQNIYDLDVIQVPTNEPMIREDMPDRIYKTEDGKFKSLIEDVAERNEAGQPVLIGTSSIEKNEKLSKMLSDKGIDHEVLNAKNNEKEAEIVEKAGSWGSVTLATNIAGRGTDIVLGDGVREVGGLHVLGSERHESRRIDNQLRGRAGRQGDPGSSQFYVSLEDDIMRIFGGERMSGVMNSLGVDDTTPIENKMISKQLEGAQKRVESHNYDSRKNVLQYDDVMDKHRQTIYARRRQILEDDSHKEEVLEMVSSVIKHDLLSFQSAEDEEGVDRDGIIEHFKPWLPLDESAVGKASQDDLHTVLLAAAENAYESREEQFGEEMMRHLERHIYLGSLDRLWMDHLESMSHLREGIQWRGMAQRQPIVEYKREARIMFDQLLADIEQEVATNIFRVAPRAQKQPEESETELTKAARQAQASGGSQQKEGKTNTVRKTESEKVGRNDACPCGSGLKYKKCGLINAPEHKS